MRAERGVVLHVLAQCLPRFPFVLARSDPQAQLGARGGRDGIGGGRDIGDVDPRNGQRRLGPQPRRDRAAPGKLHTVQHAGVLAEAVLVVVHVRVVLAQQPRDGHGAVVVVQGRDQSRQQRGCVQNGPAEHAGVHRVVQHADLHDPSDDAAQARRECRDAHFPVRGVRDHDDVRGELVPVRGQEVLETGRTGLLLALDEHGHTQTRLFADVLEERTQRTHVCHDAGLVVGRAATPEPTVLLHGLERLGVPQFALARRLDVVVGVQQDRRVPGCRGLAGDDGGVPRRVPEGLAQDLHAVEGQAPEQAGDGLGTALEVGGVERVPRDAGDRHEGAEFFQQGVPGAVHARPEGVDGVGAGTCEVSSHGPSLTAGARRAPWHARSDPSCRERGDAVALR